MHLGEELRTIRESKGLNARDCADKAGISTSALTSIERGERYPSLDTLEGLAACLNIQIIVGPDETVIEPLS